MVPRTFNLMSILNRIVGAMEVWFRQIWLYFSPMEVWFRQIWLYFSPMEVWFRQIWLNFSSMEVWFRQIWLYFSPMEVWFRQIWLYFSPMEVWFRQIWLYFSPMEVWFRQNCIFCNKPYLVSVSDCECLCPVVGITIMLPTSQFTECISVILVSPALAVFARCVQVYGVTLPSK